ncbi:hypothetical protein [Nocardiopsis halotolerans]|uniref:hypothetical protein n=1 Tax=Nocardiopsis halotolerans TaxID=124252 RepID=UPI000346DF5A|nr:hypothetical protein [Nocardiopsis halotolerans]
MEHPIGRHRRPRQSLAGRVWALTATILAIALAYVFVPQHPQRERAAITPPPQRPELPPAPANRAPVQGSRDFPGEQVWRASASHSSPKWKSDDRPRTPHTPVRTETSVPCPDPDGSAGALVRPYMPPFPRVPAGDLLAAPPVTPPPERADDMGDLAAAIRLYLHRVG